MVELSIHLRALQLTAHILHCSITETESDKADEEGACISHFRRHSICLLEQTEDYLKPHKET